MKDERTHHGAMDKSLSEQQICISTSIFCIGRKTGPILLPLVSLMAAREGGSLADEMRMGFEIFKILYRLNYSCFYFDCYHSDVTTLLEVYFSRLLSSKTYFKVYFKCKKFSSHFFMLIPTTY